MLDTKSLCLWGVKILSAVAVGAAVVLGIDKLSKNNNQQQTPPPPCDNGMNGGLFVPQGQPQQGQQGNFGNSGNSTCDSILEGLRTTQNVCKGVISVGAAIGGVVQCIGQLSNCINGRQQPQFNNNMNGGNAIFGGYYNRGYINQPDQQPQFQGFRRQDGEELTLVRRSNYVLSCVPKSQAANFQQF